MEVGSGVWLLFVLVSWWCLGCTGPPLVMVVRRRSGADCYHVHERATDMVQSVSVGMMAMLFGR
jgi:hypothetical protein